MGAFENRQAQRIRGCCVDDIIVSEVATHRQKDVDPDSRTRRH